MLLKILRGDFLHHPLHPLFVHFPVALWISSFIFDVIYFANGNSNFAVSSYYCMATGLFGAFFSILAGLVEYISIPQRTLAKRIAIRHMTLNLSITILYLINFFTRRGALETPPVTVTNGVFIMSLISVVLLAYSGYLGGVMVYQLGLGSKSRGDAQKHVGRAA